MLNVKIKKDRTIFENVNLSAQHSREHYLLSILFVFNKIPLSLIIA